jgi:aminoglycoside phosphotransferase family enzyme
LIGDLLAVQHESSKAEYGLDARLVNWVIPKVLELVYRRPAIFDARVRSGKIVEGHGDLRPEHICLEDPPVAIDCLEFNRDLRTLDAVSELSFLGLECDRLGAAEVGDYIMMRYSEQTGDRPPLPLLRFYKAFHACVRAKVAVRHLEDKKLTDREHWRARAAQYLELADLQLKGPCNLAREL